MYMSTIKRHFLGWDKPFLLEASKWLQDNCLQMELGSNHDCVVVVSSSSAARRLQSLLVEEASVHGRAINLPRVVTTSSFLRELHQDYNHVASNSIVHIATASVLRSSTRDELKPLLGLMEENFDNQPFSFWLAAAKEVQAVASECLAGGYSTDTSTWPQEAQLILTAKTKSRFNAICRVQDAVQKFLESNSLQTQEQAWSTFLSSGYQSTKRIVLLATTDLHNIVCQAVRHCANTGSEIHAVVRAPKSYASYFDDIGCLCVDLWNQEHISISESSLHVAGSPSDQAIKVLEQCKGEYAVDEFTVAVTSEESIGYIRRQFEGHGFATRFAGGTSAASSSEYALVEAVCLFLRTKSFNSYASLVRHPYIARILHITSSELHHLDAYFNNHIPNYIGKTWFVPKGVSEHVDVRPVVDLHSRIYSWLKVLIGAARMDVHSCAKIVRDFFIQVYGEEKLEQKSKRLAVLGHIFSALDVLSSLPQNITESVGDIAPVDAFDFILAELAGSSIPEYPNENAIEIVGWLDSMLDDSPHLCVVGMDSSLVSSASIGHSLIPGALRQALGLLTVERKLARDTHAIVAMQKEREIDGQIDWIIARKTAGGDLLAPNPLLLRCENDDELAARTNKLLIDAGSEKLSIPPESLNAETSSTIPVLKIPKPSEICVKPINRISVTAFKNYLSCSYRFWLRHVLRVDEESDDLSELDYSHFGTLVHRVLESFGKDIEVRDETSADLIRAYLFKSVDATVELLFGKYPLDTIKVQAEMAKHRLSIFADLQARRARQGWKITDTERKIEWQQGTKEEPFTVVGKIDRIDTHEDGSVQLLDYKTGSTKTEKLHCKDGQWIDLQLPIYRHLAVSAGYDMSKIETGLILIGSKEQLVQFDFPNWTEEEFDTADSQIEFVIKQVKDMIFAEEPNSNAPQFSEGLSWICQDTGLVQDTEAKTL